MVYLVAWILLVWFCLFNCVGLLLEACLVIVVISVCVWVLMLVGYLRCLVTLEWFVL